MKSNGRTVRTMVRAEVRTYTGRFVRGCRQHKPRNNPILKSKIAVFTQIAVGWQSVPGRKSSQLLYGRDFLFYSPGSDCSNLASCSLCTVQDGMSQHFDIGLSLNFIVCRSGGFKKKIYKEITKVTRFLL